MLTATLTTPGEDGSAYTVITFAAAEDSGLTADDIETVEVTVSQRNRMLIEPEEVRKALGASRRLRRAERHLGVVPLRLDVQFLAVQPESSRFCQSVN